MKKNFFKKPLFYILISVLFLLLSYFGYYFFILRDQYKEYVSSFNSLNGSSEEGFNLDIIDFDPKSCDIQYQVNYEVKTISDLPCPLLEKNEYEEPGDYKIKMSFTRYKFFPFGKVALQNWYIEKLDTQSINIEELVSGLKAVLKDKYLWEVYSIPISLSSNNPENWFSLEKVSINNEYLKSIYLLKELILLREDSELEDIFDKEILYLNNNVDILLSQNKNPNYPEAYLLELIDLGLDSKYLSLINNFEIPVYTEESLNNRLIEPIKIVDYNNEDILSYSYMSKYFDYYKEFEKYKRNDLKEYSLNKMIEYYNNGNYYLNGLCSIAAVMNQNIDKNSLRSELTIMLDSNQDSLIKSNVTELLQCQKVFRGANVEFEKLNTFIEDLIVDRLRVIDKGCIITDYVNSEVGDIPIFDMSENLIYLINSYED